MTCSGSRIQPGDLVKRRWITRSQKRRWVSLHKSRGKARSGDECGLVTHVKLQDQTYLCDVLWSNGEKEHHCPCHHMDVIQQACDT